MPLAGLLTGRVFQPKWMIIVSMIGTGLAMFHFSRLDLDISFWTLSLARIYLVVWLPFLFIPVSAASYIGVPPAANNQASAIINLMRNIGSSVGVSVVTTQLQWRTQFHHERLAEQITPYSNPFPGQSLAQVDHIVQTQASMLSYIDNFWMLGWVALLLWPIVLLMGRLPKGAPAGH